MIGLRRRGLVEMLIGIGLLWLVTTGAAAEGAAADGISEELLTVAGVTAVFICGMGYADIRAKATSAHRRMDRKEDAEKQTARDLAETLNTITRELEAIRLALAGRGIPINRES